MEKNKCYKVTTETGEEKTIWDGRYACVVAIVFAKDDKGIYVLANKRGSGAPNNVGLWNMPCGYIDAGTVAENAAREVYEETGLKLDPKGFVPFGYGDDERNITLRLVYPLENKPELGKIEDLTGEPNEVTEIQWIPIQDTPNYEWAFNHLFVLGEIITSCK